MIYCDLLLIYYDFYLPSIYYKQIYFRFTVIYYPFNIDLLSIFTAIITILFIKQLISLLVALKLKVRFISYYSI